MLIPFFLILCLLIDASTQINLNFSHLPDRSYPVTIARVVFYRGVDPRLLAPSGVSSRQDNDDSLDSESESDASTVTERVRPHRPKSASTRGQYCMLTFAIRVTSRIDLNSKGLYQQEVFYVTVTKII